LDQISNPQLCNLKEGTTLEWYIYRESRIKHLIPSQDRPQTPSKAQLLDDDIFHISHLHLTPEFTIPIQLFPGMHCEDQQSSDDMETALKHSAAAQLQDTQTVSWTQVRVTTSSNSNTSSLLSINEEGIPDQRSQLPPQLRDCHQFRDNLYSVDGVIMYKDRMLSHHP